MSWGYSSQQTDKNICSHVADILAETQAIATLK